MILCPSLHVECEKFGGNEKGKWFIEHFFISEPVLRLVLLKAFPAIYRPAFSWFERNLAFCSTVGANDIVHLAGPVVSGAVVSARPLSSVHY